MTKFRWHRGGLEESMQTVLPAYTYEDLQHILGTNEFTLRHQGFDGRINWDSFIVTVNGEAVGFTDGIPE